MLLYNESYDYISKERLVFNEREVFTQLKRGFFSTKGIKLCYENHDIIFFLLI